MQLIKSSSIFDGMKVNSLSIGDSGKGKTYFSGTICAYGKPFFIDAEDGLKTLYGKEFDACQVDSYDQFGEACEWYAKNYKEKGYTHLVVDSITRLQQYLARDLGDEKGKVTLPQWGQILATLRKSVDWLTKKCPTSVHVTAMAMESKDEITGGTKIFPNLQGSFKYDLASYFDVVLYHDCGEKGGKQVYWVQTQGDTRIVAKSRFDSIQPLKKFEVSDYSIIENIITKAQGGNQ